MAGIEQRGGQPQPEQPRQPEQTQPQQGRAEGRQSLQGPTTVDRSEPLQSQQESPERQPLPRVWDVLERQARAFDEFPVGRISRAEYDREREEVNRLKAEIEEKGIDRDKHILALLFIRRPRLSRLSAQQQIQQWREQVDRLSDEDIAECARKRREDIEAFRRGEIPLLSFHPSVGDGELILADYIAEKGKRG